MEGAHGLRMLTRLQEAVSSTTRMSMTSISRPSTSWGLISRRSSRRRSCTRGGRASREAKAMISRQVQHELRPTWLRSKRSGPPSLPSICSSRLPWAVVAWRALSYTSLLVPYPRQTTRRLDIHMSVMPYQGYNIEGSLSQGRPLHSSSAKLRAAPRIPDQH